jgi:hypothetical protein
MTDRVIEGVKSSHSHQTVSWRKDMRRMHLHIGGLLLTYPLPSPHMIGGLVSLHKDKSCPIGEFPHRHDSI